MPEIDAALRRAILDALAVQAELVRSVAELTAEVKRLRSDVDRVYVRLPND